MPHLLLEHLLLMLARQRSPLQQQQQCKIGIKWH
jgi:hypothetical protein